MGTACRSACLSCSLATVVNLCSSHRSKAGLRLANEEQKDGGVSPQLAFGYQPEALAHSFKSPLAFRPSDVPLHLPILALNSSGQSPGRDLDGVSRTVCWALLNSLQMCICAFVLKSIELGSPEPGCPGICSSLGGSTDIASYPAYLLSSIHLKSI